MRSHFSEMTHIKKKTGYRNSSDSVCLFLLQARHDISNDDIPAARRHWRTACQWPYFGACIWVSIILSIVISGLIIGIVFAIVL